MATAALEDSSKKILCKYFANNACRKGDSCRFSHDRTARADNVCRYYLAGTCVYGSACRYDHKRPTSTQSSEKKKTPSASRPPTEGKRKDDAAKPVGASVSFSTHKFSADAPEFVPSRMKVPAADGLTYAAVSGAVSLRPLCPYFETGNCDKGDECEFVHGMVCDMCNVACLHPADAEQRKQHRKECVEAHEEEMKRAFAEARSADKVCGICMENIRERRARFGILEGCRHCFCFDCIHKWRSNSSEQFDKKTVRSCPECRIHSNFVIPAPFWVEDEDDKKELIAKFRENNKQKQCKYLLNGKLEDCPFGNKCFFKHQLPDGTIAEGESPRTLRRRRRRLISFANDDEFYERLLLSDHLYLDDSDSDSDYDNTFSDIVQDLFVRAFLDNM